MYKIHEHIHIVLIVLPLIYALQLFAYKNTYGKHNKILGTMMIALSIYYLMNLLITFNIYALNVLGTLLILPLFLTIHPFFYTYIKSLTTENFKLDKKILINFLPAAIFFFLASVDVALVLISEKTFRPVVEMFEKLQLPVAIIIYYIQFIIYTILIILLLIEHQRNVKINFSYTENITLNWVFVCVIIYTIMTIFDTMVFFTTLFNAYSRVIYYIFMTLFVTFLGFFGIKQNDIYIVKQTQTSDEKNNTNIEENLRKNNIEVPRETKYATSALNETQKDFILKELIRLVENEKIFKNQKLSLDDISEILKINKKYISQTINERLGKNFFQFINEYRVKEIIAILESNEYKNYTIEAIGEIVGFHSQPSMISAFKKYTGLTPSQYIKKIQNKNNFS